MVDRILHLMKRTSTDAKVDRDHFLNRVFFFFLFEQQQGVKRGSTYSSLDEQNFN